jgi:hypothetical protein
MTQLELIRSLVARQEFHCLCKRAFKVTAAVCKEKSVTESKAKVTTTAKKKTKADGKIPARTRAARKTGQGSIL